MTASSNCGILLYSVKHGICSALCARVGDSTGRRGSCRGWDDGVLPDEKTIPPASRATGCSVPWQRVM